MKIWIVIVWDKDLEMDFISGVFDSQEKADAAADAAFLSSGIHSDYVTVECKEVQ